MREATMEHGEQGAAAMGVGERAAQVVIRARDTLLAAFDLAAHTALNVRRLAEAIDRDGRAVAADAVALWAAVQEASQRARAAAQATPRVARVLGAVARVAAVYRVHHLEVAARGAAAPREAAVEALHRREARRIRALCEELGGGILKVGQLLSARGDLLPAAWVEELSGLQDRAEASPAEAVRALLEAELGDLDAVFAELEVEPIAAASLAQVHRATLIDGTPVAVKVQRPGVDRIIAQDRTALTLVADLFGAALPGVPVRAMADEVARSLVEELDFEAEAETARAFGAAIGGHVWVPRVHGPTTRRVLVLELIDGARLGDYLAGADAGGRDAVLGQLARAMAISVLAHGLVHGDPHPGNFLVAAPREAGGAPRLVMLDFGAALRLTEGERRAYLALLPALFARDEARVRASLDALGFTADEPGAPTAFALRFAEVIVPSDLAAIDPRVELERALAMAREHAGLVVPPHFVRLGRALAGVGGLFMVYRPKLDLPALVVEAMALAPR